MKKHKIAPFKWKPLSEKQLKVLTWWMPKSPVHDKDAIICDGSVRAGKTVVMSFSYVMWAMTTFDGENLGMAGKTIGALRRNVIQPLKRILKGRGYKVKDHRADNYLIVSYRGRSNTFYLFGGKDESSQDLIQGITLAGMFFDEVALMPESFVNQATARCSVDGAKLWFNCNPAGPYHWFKTNWLDKLNEKNAIHLHFTMDDNLSLSPRVKERYRRMYSGVFFKRYILGLWVMAEGIIYDMFQDDVHKIYTLPDSFEKYYVGIDYGTSNPCVFLLIGLNDGKYYVIKEYYHDSRATGKQKTDAQYSTDFQEFIKDKAVSGIFIDPSATSFIAQLKANGVTNIFEADNTVLDGIRTVSTALSNMTLFIYQKCVNTLKEFYSYAWDEKAQQRGEDKPIKQFDHAMDALRYAIYNITKMPKYEIY
ncbi:MAG: PBSX family phage terminase large subunit [Bacillota bacterium]